VVGPAKRAWDDSKCMLFLRGGLNRTVAIYSKRCGYLKVSEMFTHCILIQHRQILCRHDKRAARCVRPDGDGGPRGRAGAGAVPPPDGDRASGRGRVQGGGCRDQPHPPPQPPGGVGGLPSDVGAGLAAVKCLRVAPEGPPVLGVDLSASLGLRAVVGQVGMQATP